MQEGIGNFTGCCFLGGDTVDNQELPLNKGDPHALSPPHLSLVPPRHTCHLFLLDNQSRMAEEHRKDLIELLNLPLRQHMGFLKLNNHRLEVGGFEIAD